MKEERYESIASERVLKEFDNPKGRTLMNHAFNTCHIENYLSVASVLWPSIVEVEGCIFIAEFYNGGYDKLYERFRGDKRAMERWVNAWSLGEFFLLAWDEQVLNETLFDSFCHIVKFFWTRRVRELFPERDIIIELGENMEGENGMAITLYQSGHQFSDEGERRIH